jgi:4-hydroxybenzoate polyprenyltransferase
MTLEESPTTMRIVRRVPSVLLWTWLNTFVFVLANQRHPEAIIEDCINKPWRPLAARRITQVQTTRLLLLSIPFTLALCYLFLGAVEETALLFILTWMYNDLGGSDENVISRNLIIALAYILYGSGALRIASQCGMRPEAFFWQITVGSVIFTTMQVQDLKDQEGDRARKRKTAPIAIGDTITRWSIAVSVMSWSFFCPNFWDLSVLGYLMPLGVGITVSTRVLYFRDSNSDRITWKIWAFWLSTLYFLPVMKYHS